MTINYNNVKKTLYTKGWEKLYLTKLNALTEKEKYNRFMERIEAGEKIEAEDWMPDDYRMVLIKLISMHGISEIMGALPEKEWVPTAPSLRRKLASRAMLREAVGHAQLILRVAAELMEPMGKNRADIMESLL